MSNRWFRRCLGLCVPLVALLWVAGVVHFHGLALLPVEWVIVAAAGFALYSIWRRMVPQRPLPQLPKDANPVTLAALAAAIVALPFGLLASLFEIVVDDHFPSRTSMPLRGLWHTACAYAGSYCAFLARLSAARPIPPR